MSKFLGQFMDAARIVSGDTWRFDPRTGEAYKAYKGREWFDRERSSYDLHPAVFEVLEQDRFRPLDWHQLLLEWPHRSVTDYNRVAYTRDERAGIANKQTITTLGRYINRHFPLMPDHVVRDLVARFCSQGEYSLHFKTADIVRAALKGPHSCMSAHLNINCDDGNTRHPYEVYDPALGWGIALRTVDGSIDGRALVWIDPDEEANRGFVRTYKRTDGYSYADEALCAWLKSQGYQHWGEWPEGTMLRYFPVGKSFLAPYIDGGEQRVTVRPGLGYLVISSEGEYECDHTSGTGGSTGECCEDCSEYYDDDDMYSVGRFEDRRVCCNCIDSYHWGRGYRGNEYHIYEDDVVFVDGSAFDVNWLSHNDIVELGDGSGEYAELDETVCIDGVYYRNDDEDICYDEHNNEYYLISDCEHTEDKGMVHRSDAWQCSVSDLWYSDDVDPVVIDGILYHPDNAPATEESNGE